MTTARVMYPLPVEPTSRMPQLVNRPITGSATKPEMGDTRWLPPIDVTDVEGVIAIERSFASLAR